MKCGEGCRGVAYSSQLTNVQKSEVKRTMWNPKCESKRSTGTEDNRPQRAIEFWGERRN